MFKSRCCTNTTPWFPKYSLSGSSPIGFKVTSVVLARYNSCEIRLFTGLWLNRSYKMFKYTKGNSALKTLKSRHIKEIFPSLATMVCVVFTKEINCLHDVCLRHEVLKILLLKWKKYRDHSQKLHRE